MPALLSFAPSILKQPDDVLRRSINAIAFHPRIACNVN
jgi:hypothetical protein